MSQIQKTFTLPLDHANALEAVVTLLGQNKNEDYYAYERGEFWHVGLGSRATLVIDSKGETAKFCTEGKRELSPVEGPLADIARQFVSKNSQSGSKIYGQVGFNYAAHIRGQEYAPGQWPLLSLLVPRTEVLFHRNQVTVIGPDEDTTRAVLKLLNLVAHTHRPGFLSVNTQPSGVDYTRRVARALLEIAEYQYTKVIVSRAVDIEDEIDMPATLLWGRRGNTPARTFSLKHDSCEATGFSPELVMSLKNGKLITEPLAGTRSHTGSADEVEKKRLELLSDSKEIVEHILSVKAAMEELTELCEPDSVMVEDLMSVRERGSVQHLGSRVAGSLSVEKDGWDAFNVLFPSITASGISKDAAISAILRLESRPRELYSGAVLLLEGTESFEATLVLRTVFQDQTRRWTQAGAGIIAQSDPQRELNETREKLASIVPFIVGKAGDLGI